MEKKKNRLLAGALALAVCMGLLCVAPAVQASASPDQSSSLPVSSSSESSSLPPEGSSSIGAEDDESASKSGSLPEGSSVGPQDSSLSLPQSGSTPDAGKGDSSLPRGLAPDPANTAANAPAAPIAAANGNVISSIQLSGTEITSYTPDITFNVNASEEVMDLYGAFTHETDPTSVVRFNSGLKGFPCFEIDNGVYALPAGKGDLQPYLPGKYTLTSISYAIRSQGMVQGRREYGPDGADGPLPAELAGLFVNVNLPTDTTPPVLTGISDVTDFTYTPGIRWSPSLTVTDDISGWGGTANISFRLKGTSFEVVTIYTSGFVIMNPDDWANGEYEISKVWIADRAGNLSTYEGSALASIPGADATFTVSGCNNQVLTTATDADVVEAIKNNAGAGTADNPAVIAAHYAEGDCVLDPAVFEELFRTPNVILRVSLSNGLVWIFKGGEQAAPAAPVDLNVQFVGSTLAQRWFDTNGPWGYVLDFPANGNLPVKTELFIPTWSANGGAASLYFVKPDGSGLELECANIPHENGGYTVPFTHNSTFIITDRALGSNAGNSGADSSSSSGAATTTPLSPRTGVCQ